MRCLNFAAMALLAFVTMSGESTSAELITTRAQDRHVVRIVAELLQRERNE